MHDLHESGNSVLLHQTVDMRRHQQQGKQKQHREPQWMEYERDGNKCELTNN